MVCDVDIELRNRVGGIISELERLSKEECDFDAYPDGIDDDGGYHDLWTYLGENMGVHYVVDENVDVIGCNICIAWGGPNIYIDTIERTVKGYWGTATVTLHLSEDIVEDIDEWAYDRFHTVLSER